MTIPANIVAPIFAFDVRSAGQFENETRMLILGHVAEDAAAGRLAVGEIAACNTRFDARTLCGAGTMLESMFLKARLNAPAQEIWIGAVDDSGTAEVRTIEVDAVPAAGGQGVLLIAGEVVAVELAAGGTVNAAAAAISAAINGFFNKQTAKSLPFTASVATPDESTERMS